MATPQTPSVSDETPQWLVEADRCLSRRKGASTGAPKEGEPEGAGGDDEIVVSTGPPSWPAFKPLDESAERPEGSRFVVPPLSKQLYGSAASSALSYEVRSRLELLASDSEATAGLLVRNGDQLVPEEGSGSKDPPSPVGIGGRTAASGLAGYLPPIIGQWKNVVQLREYVEKEVVEKVVKGGGKPPENAVLVKALRQSMRLSPPTQLTEPIDTPAVYAHVADISTRVEATKADTFVEFQYEKQVDASTLPKLTDESVVTATMAYAGVAMPLLWAGVHGAERNTWVQMRVRQGKKLKESSGNAFLLDGDGAVVAQCSRIAEVLAALETVHLDLAEQLVVAQEKITEGPAVLIDRFPAGKIFCSACPPEEAEFLMLYVLACDLPGTLPGFETLRRALLKRARRAIGTYFGGGGGDDVALLQQLEQLRVENERLRRDAAAAGAGDVDDDEARQSRVRWRETFLRLLSMFANNKEAGRDTLQREAEAEWFSMGKEDFDLIGLMIKELYSPFDWPTEEGAWVAQGYTPDELDKYEVQAGVYFDNTPRMKLVVLPKKFARRRIAVLSLEQWEILGIGREDLDDLVPVTPTAVTQLIYWPKDGVANALMAVLLNPSKFVLGFLEKQAQLYEPWEGKDDVMKRKKAIADKEAKRVKDIEDAAKKKTEEDAKRAVDTKRANELKANYDRWLPVWRAMASRDPAMPEGPDKTNWTNQSNNLLLLMTLLTDKRIGDALNKTTMPKYLGLSQYLMANGQIVDGILFRLLTHSKKTDYTKALATFLTMKRSELQSVVDLPTWWTNSLSVKYAEETAFEIDVTVRPVDGPVLNEEEAMAAVEEAQAAQQRAQAALAAAEQENLKKDPETKLQRFQALQLAKEAKSDADDALAEALEALEYAQTVGLTPAQLKERQKRKAEAEAAAEAARLAEEQAAAKRAEEEAEAARKAEVEAEAAAKAGLLTDTQQALLDAQEALVEALEALKQFNESRGSGMAAIRAELPVKTRKKALVALKDNSYVKEFVDRWEAEAKAGTVNASEFVARWRADKGEPPKPGEQAPELTPEEQEKKAKVEALEEALRDALEEEQKKNNAEDASPIFIEMAKKNVANQSKKLNKEAGEGHAEKFVADWKAANPPSPPTEGLVGGHWAEQLLGLQPIQAATMAWLEALLDHHSYPIGIGEELANTKRSSIWVKNDEAARLDVVLRTAFYDRAKDAAADFAQLEGGHAIDTPEEGEPFLKTLVRLASAGVLI